MKRRGRNDSNIRRPTHRTSCALSPRPVVTPPSITPTSILTLRLKRADWLVLKIALPPPLVAAVRPCCRSRIRRPRRSRTCQRSRFCETPKISFKRAKKRIAWSNSLVSQLCRVKRTQRTRSGRCALVSTPWMSCRSRVMMKSTRTDRTSNTITLSIQSCEKWQKRQ